MDRPFENQPAVEPHRAPSPACGDGPGADIKVSDSRRWLTMSIQRILVLKLDHLGDFIIGRPALQALRDAFPKAHIRLICGSWNLKTARDSGLADDVRAYDFFPERAAGWDGKPEQDLSLFDMAAAGSFDLAIDMRVDDDTRQLLKRVDAVLRCGIGTRRRFEFLDIILPPQPKTNEPFDLSRPLDLTFGPGRFSSRMERQNPFIHETDAHVFGTHVIFGPYVQLPRGRYRALFGLRSRGFYGWPTTRLTIETARDERTLASASVKPRALRGSKSRPPTIDFDIDQDPSDDQVGKVEFRVHVKGLSLIGTLQFTGVIVQKIGDVPAPRYKPVEIHIGDQLYLLVELIKQRLIFNHLNETNTRHIEKARKVIIAPLSNSSLRDWPIDHYRRLVQLILRSTDCHVSVVGSSAQQQQVADLIGLDEQSGRVSNLAGRTNWQELAQLLSAADLVICNNSGVAHQAAALGTPTLAIYSASHQPQEWGPRGPTVRTLMAEVACSPCGFDRLEDCTAQHLCMRLITPEFVLSQVKAMLDADTAVAQIDTPPAAMDVARPGAV